MKRSYSERFIEVVLDPSTWKEKARYLLKAAPLFGASFEQFAHEGPLGPLPPGLFEGKEG